MRYRALDAAGDFTFGFGQANFLRDTPAAVGQAVLTRLRLLRGEWKFDLSQGTPWSTEILGENTAATYDAAIRTRILETPGVTELTAYSSTVVNRRLTVTATITTLYGETTVQAVL